MEAIGTNERNSEVAWLNVSVVRAVALLSAAKKEKKVAS